MLPEIRTSVDQVFTDQKVCGIFRGIIHIAKMRLPQGMIDSTSGLQQKVAILSPRADRAYLITDIHVAQKSYPNFEQIESQGDLRGGLLIEGVQYTEGQPQLLTPIELPRSESLVDINSPSVKGTKPQAAELLLIDIFSGQVVPMNKYQAILSQIAQSTR